MLGAMPVINNFATYHSHPSLLLFCEVDTSAEDKEVSDCPKMMKLAIDQSLAKRTSIHFLSMNLTIIRRVNGRSINKYEAISDFKWLE